MILGLLIYFLIRKAQRNGWKSSWIVQFVSVGIGVTIICEIVAFATLFPERFFECAAVMGIVPGFGSLCGYFWAMSRS